MIFWFWYTKKQLVSRLDSHYIDHIVIESLGCMLARRFTFIIDWFMSIDLGPRGRQKKGYSAMVPPTTRRGGLSALLDGKAHSFNMVSCYELFLGKRICLSHVFPVIFWSLDCLQGTSIGNRGFYMLLPLHIAVTCEINKSTDLRYWRFYSPTMHIAALTVACIVASAKLRLFNCGRRKAKSCGCKAYEYWLFMAFQYILDVYILYNISLHTHTHTNTAKERKQLDTEKFWPGVPLWLEVRYGK